MATGTASAQKTPTSVQPGYDHVIDTQLARTSWQVKMVELVGSAMLYVIALVLFFLLVAFVDHWIVGLGFWGRLLAFLTVVAGSLWFATVQILNAMKTINPVYAAKVIEQSTPSLKNSLVNMLMFRPSSAPIHQMMVQALRQKAAADLSHVPMDHVVDRTQLIRLGYVLAAVLALCAGYKIISPKDPLQTVSRVIAPWADIARPSRVQIAAIEPGDAAIIHGQIVTVSAQVDVVGMSAPGPVTLYFSTADGQTIDRPVPMQRATDSIRYECKLPPHDAGVTNSFGLQQDATYYIVAGDAISPKFRLTVKPAPTILVQRLEYAFPSYTAKPPQTIERQGDIQALEGTKVTVFAHASQPIKSAYIEFDPPTTNAKPNGAAAANSPSKIVPMKFSEDTASLTFQLELAADKRTPKHTSYQVRFVTADGQRNEPPIRHQIQVIPDLPPEIEILTPTRDRIDLPVNGRQKIEIRAVDPDFGVSRITLRAVSGGNDVLTKELLVEPKGRPGQAVVVYDFVPTALHLKPGDEVTYWASVDDNRTAPQSGLPEPNSQRTRNHLIRVIAANETAPPKDAPNAADKNDPRNPERKDGEPAGNDSPRGPEKNSDPNNSADKPNKPTPPAGEKQTGEKPADKPQDGNDPAQNSKNQNNKNQSGSKSSEKQDQGGSQSQNGGGSGDKQGDKQNGQQNSPNNGGQSGSPSGEKSNDSQNSQPSGNGQGNNSSSNNDAQSPNNSGQNARGGGKPSNNQNPSRKPSGEKPEAGSSPANGNQAGEPAGNDANQAGNDGAPEGGRRNGDGTRTGEAGRQEKPHDGEVIEKALEHFREQQKRQQDQKNGGQNSATSPKPDASKQPSDGQNKDSASGESQNNPSSKLSAPNDKSQQPNASGSQSGAAEKSPNAGQPGEKPGADKTGKNPSSDQGDAGSDTSKKPNQDGGSSENKSPSDTKSPGGKSQNPSGKPDKTSPQNMGEGDPQTPKPGQGDAGQSGAGQNDKQNPAPPSQGKNRDRDKNDSGSGRSLKTGNDATSPSTSDRQSDSKSDSDGDKSGGGGQGGGQSGNKKGNESPGQNSPSDEGANQTNEKGTGADSQRAGDQKQAGQKTGQAGQEKGAGSGSAPSDKGSEKPKDPKNAGTKQTSGPGNGVPTGGGLPGENQSSQNAGNAAVPDGDPANLEYARRATDLALEHLKNQKDNPDRELLEKLGWTKDELQQFLQRWEAMKRDAAKGSSDNGKRDLDDALRSLGLRPQADKKRAAGVTNDAQRGLRDAGSRSAPPSSYQEQFNAFRKGTARTGGDQK